MPSEPYYRIVITRFSQEEGEIGRQWCRTGKKDEAGADVWDYSPSMIGTKEVSRNILDQYVDHAIDIPALQRLVNRKPKA